MRIVYHLLKILHKHWHKYHHDKFYYKEPFCPTPKQEEKLKKHLEKDRYHMGRYVHYWSILEERI